MEDLAIGLYYRPWVLFLWGACWGSFLNVVLYRFPRKLSVVFPSSSCPSCHSAIAPYDNVPVLSWLILRGRCRSCKASISPRYLFNEVLVGLLNMGPVWFFPPQEWRLGIGWGLLLTWTLPTLYLLARYRRAPWYLMLGAAAGLVLLLWR